MMWQIKQKIKLNKKEQKEVICSDFIDVDY